jgi:hypothetical protein
VDAFRHPGEKFFDDDGIKPQGRAAHGTQYNQMAPERPAFINSLKLVRVNVANASRTHF